MGINSNISWCDSSWNPWHGCKKVSQGCKFCYMYRDKARYGQNPEIVTRSKPATFNAPTKWKDARLIFTCSWSDWFIAEADNWREEAWEIIKRTPQHTYQILTKRPERIKEHLPGDWSNGYQNVWLGVSVEDAAAKSRIDELRQVPAQVRFLSVEPLLSEVTPVSLLGIDWVIVGGESGPDHRLMDLQHARNVRDACLTQGVPFFFKQVGGTRPSSKGDLLDGVQWQQMPGQTAEVM